MVRRKRGLAPDREIPLTARRADHNKRQFDKLPALRAVVGERQEIVAAPPVGSPTKIRRVAGRNLEQKNARAAAKIAADRVAAKRVTEAVAGSDEGEQNPIGSKPSNGRFVRKHSQVNASKLRLTSMVPRKRYKWCKQIFDETDKDGDGEP